MFEEILQKIARLFAVNRVPYMIMGGQAVLVYGEPRLTRDIDVTLGVGIEKLDGILKIVDALGFKLLVNDVSQFVRETMVLPVMDENSGVRIDIIFSFSPFERQDEAYILKWLKKFDRDPQSALLTTFKKIKKEIE